MTIEGFPLHKRQKEIINDIIKSDAKYFIINASRQSGKSVALSELVRYFALTTINQKLLYITPTYGLASTFFDNIIDSLYGIPVIQNANKSKLTIKFKNNSTLIFKSAERFDNIRGLSVDYLFLDEFSFFKIGAWEAIKPTVAAKINSKVIIASTPKGKNLFYDLAMLGQSQNDRYKYYFMHYTDNPMYDMQEVEDAKKVLPESMFRTEYEAEFLDDGGTVFKNIKQHQIITSWINPIATSKYYAGLDIGKHDSTVLTILDQAGYVVRVFASKEKSYSLILDELVPILKEYKPIVYVETNGVGDVFYDMLVLKYSNITPFRTDNNSKTEIIELLMANLDDAKLKLPTKELCPELDLQFATFTYVYTPKARKITYCAMNGFHDDNIISIALANKCKTDNSRGFVIKPGLPSAFRR